MTAKHSYHDLALENLRGAHTALILEWLICECLDILRINLKILPACHIVYSSALICLL